MGGVTWTCIILIFPNFSLEKEIKINWVEGSDGIRVARSYMLFAFFIFTLVSPLKVYELGWLGIVQIMTARDGVWAKQELQANS